MKPHIIDILPHEPDYRFIKDKPRPEINWDTADGKWVGIYRNEIPDKLGREILKYTDEFEYEVWQPDYRADKMYSHRFEDGLVHRLFPAQEEKEIHGLKLQKQIHSPALVQYLKEYSAQFPLIVTLNGDICKINAHVIREYGYLPILQTFRGTLYLPKTMIFKLRLNFLASVNYMKKHLEAKQLMPSFDYVLHQNDEYLDELSQLYQGPKTKITSGCDFSFWKPMDKKLCREDLNLPADKKIFFISSLLKHMKQIDKVIEVFNKLDGEGYDFLLLISGHGTHEYERYLRGLAATLMKKDKVRFVGYITGKTLRQYYNSADLFLNASISEGGPVSAMKAIACEIPVISTYSGNVAERLREKRAGILLKNKAYKEWKEVFARVIEGMEVKKFDRSEAEEFYDWQKIAAKFAEIYRHLSDSYYAAVEGNGTENDHTNRKKSELGNYYPKR